MDFEFERFIDADEEAVEGGGEVAADGEFHEVACFYFVVSGVVGVHVDVGGGTDDALLHLEEACGAHEHTAWGTCDVTRGADGDIEAEGNGVCKGELDLIEVAAGAEDAEVGDDAAAGADEGDGLLGGVLAFLVEPLHGAKLVALAKEGFHGLGREVAVAGGNIDYQGIGRGSLTGDREAHLTINALADELLDNAAVESVCGGRGHGSGDRGFKISDL